MISYDTMVSEVTLRLGGRTDIAARIGNWINYAFFELLLNPRFSFQELDNLVTFPTALGQAIYVLDDAPINLTKANFWFILDLRDNTHNYKLEKTHHQVIDRIAPVSGQPCRYYRFRNTIVLDPIPDGIYTMQLRYRERPPRLVTGTMFEQLGDEWEEPIIVLSSIKGWEALDQRGKAGEQRQLLEPMLMSRQDIPQLEDGVDSENTIEPVTDFMRWT